MALNPKLNIFVLRLNPKDKNSHPTYHDLFRLKNNVDAHVDDNGLQDLFFQDFLNRIGTTEFRNDTRNQKVIGVSEYNAADNSASVHLLHDRCVIEGIIDGGQYGVMRAYADVDKKGEKTSLGINQAVLDKFYICLCTPLNSSEGFLLVQSYTESSIQETILAFIRDLLKCEDKFYNISITPFVPKSFIEKYKRGAKVHMFTYYSKMRIDSIMRNNQLVLEGQSFDVSISIKPTEDTILPGSDRMNEIVQQLSVKQFDGVSLEDSDSKKVYVQDGQERKAHYDLERQINDIKPTIYLMDEGITIDEETGQPDFEQISSYVLRLLELVKQECNGNQEIDQF